MSSASAGSQTLLLLGNLRLEHLSSLSSVFKLYFPLLPPEDKYS
jgi:hypothetical protein